MTNHWVDIKNADVVLIMGGNAAEAHPCGFKWVTEAKANRGAKLIVVDPRFTRSAAMADIYAPIRAGTDIAFLNGVTNYLLINNKIQEEYVKNFTNASFLISDAYKFENGLFSGYDEAKRSYDKTTWSYQKDEQGFAKVDDSLNDPRSAFQLLKAHMARYTPEMVEKTCGTPKAAFLKVCETIATTSQPNRVMTIMYALGWTQHSTGSQNIRAAAIVQLLLGNIGMAGGGINALRGHANVQGITDMNLVAQTLPGYLRMAGDGEQDFQKFLDDRSPKPLRPGQMSFGQNFPKWFVSLQKAWYGDKATKENSFGYHYQAKHDKAYDMLAFMDEMYKGKINGMVVQGFNPIASLPNKPKITAALSKLKYLVMIDPLATETSEYWKDFGEFHSAKPADIKTEVFRLPATLFAEDTGSYTNSGRVIQWHWKAADPPGEAKSDQEIMATLFVKLREMYAKDGGKGVEPLMAMSWPYQNANNPSPEELLREINGRAIGDVLDPKDPTKVLVKAGEQLPGFGFMRDDGSTSGGCWIYTGSWTQAGNNTARRDTSDPSGLGAYLNWGFAWPANRRVLYNRASADAAGKPWDAKRTLMKFGTAWAGNDVPDMRPDAKPEEKVGPFIMNAEGVARLFSLGGMAEGPFPEHYEPFETPIAANPLNSNPKAKSNPAAKIYKGDLEVFGDAKQFPYVATTYRLTEHLHFWTKHVEANAIVQPQQFIEIGDKLAAEKGIKNGDWVEVRSMRGFIKTKAVVTKRIPMLKIDGKDTHTVGIPIHWGFKGAAKSGYLANNLTPYVGDANSQTPEYKAFLVDIKKV
jgi:formate dehydrogenase-N alpha subunit